MAKSAELNIKVNDEQFQQFVKSFDALTKSIKDLDARFKGLTDSIKKSVEQTQVLNKSMETMLRVANRVQKTVSGITSHFMKWSVLIGGISALLGIGGGLFGIERLAASIMQKRRMVMGLGGDYGQTQASMINYQSVLSNPGGVLQNIRMGLGGASPQLSTLSALGIPFGSKMTPEEVLPVILDRLQDKLKAAVPGSEQLVAQSFGAQSLGLDPMDIARLKNMSKDELKALEEKIKSEGKQLSLSEQAQKAWSDLEIQFQTAKATIESIFGEKLASLAQPLSDLSKSLIDLLKALMNSGAVETILANMTSWLKGFSAYLESDDVKKDINTFLGLLSDWTPSLKTITETLNSFGENLKRINDWMNMSWTDRLKNAAVGTFHGLAGSAPPTVNIPESQSPNVNTQNRIVVPGARGGFSRAPNAPSAAPAAPAVPDTGETGAQRSIPNPFKFQPTPPAATPGKQGSLFTNRSFAFNNSFSGGLFSNSNSNFGGNVNLSSMSSVTKNRVPGPGAGSGGGGNVSLAMAGGPGGRASRGAMDMDNWQGTRVSQLVVRNTPGSNLFMAATGMA